MELLSYRHVEEGHFAVSESNGLFLLMDLRNGASSFTKAKEPQSTAKVFSNDEPCRKNATVVVDIDLLFARYLERPQRE